MFDGWLCFRRLSINARSPNAHFLPGLRIVSRSCNTTGIPLRFMLSPSRSNKIASRRAKPLTIAGDLMHPFANSIMYPSSGSNRHAGWITNQPEGRTLEGAVFGHQPLIAA
jgi:hypothetical protein